MLLDHFRIIKTCFPYCLRQIPWNFDRGTLLQFPQIARNTSKINDSQALSRRENIRITADAPQSRPMWIATFQYENHDPSQLQRARKPDFSGKPRVRKNPDAVKKHQNLSFRAR